MDWIDLARHRDQWWALVNTAMNLGGSIKCWEVLEQLHKWRILKVAALRRADPCPRSPADCVKNEENEKAAKIQKRAVDQGRRGLAFRGHDESVASVNRGNYIEVLNMLARYDSDLHNHLESSTAFRGSSPDIQNELIHSVSELMTMEIKKEISKANYVSLILDETSDVMNKCQLASVLRYVTADGNVEERFLRFTDVSSDRSANSLFNHALEILNDFECGPKLIAQTYDGAAVMASQHAGVQAKIREQYPNAIFVHCYAHRLNLVLAQSASFIKEVKVFFATLSGFRTFFAKSTKRTEALDSHLRKRFPSIAPTRWQYHSRLAETVHEYREGIENLLVSIIEEPEEWDVETISSARGLLSLLRDFDFNFMLKIFSSIFPYSGALFKILQTKRSDIAFCNTKIDEFKHHMQRLRGGFDHLWSEMENVFDSNGPTRPKRIRIDSMSGEERKNSYKRLFCEIIDVVCQNVSVRFSENATLLFLSLLDARYFPMYRTSFPEKAFSCLKENYGAFFDFVALKSELLVMFSDPDMAKDSVYDLHQYMYALQLSCVFPQIFKLCELVLTIPATSAADERSFSALKRLKNYLRNSQNQDRLSSLALMNIEKSFLNKLQSKPSFLNEVIDLFAKKNRRIELNYKQ
ncbi:hypothetical protein B7P43_G08175 [Cryptotermes secundus]|uniref:DUF4371 domain-containing protein n=1 Tax=Cryptotermes secundus TaxID=105785 RepID=A0A2J7RI71_9NEOP|nr:hypothetical protein B7P43_G08175 [Cryptotermes secundus]